MPPSIESRVRYWRPDTAAVTAMVRVERAERPRAMYGDQFSIVVVLEGAFDGWYRGGVHSVVAGSLKLKEPGEVHRPLRIHAPITMQGAAFAPEAIAAVADAMGFRGPPHFASFVIAPRARATRRAFAMHEALVRDTASVLERETLIAETLAEVVASDRCDGERAPRAVRLARAFLHDAVAHKVTLDELSAHAGLDKYRLVRAFRSALGLPPYEYLTALRIARARELLRRGDTVAHVAHALGFCDESQLHRHFRRMVGVTPGVYARSVGPQERQHRPRRRAAAATSSDDAPHGELRSLARHDSPR